MKNESAFRIFILEDDVWYGSMLQHYLSLNPDYEVKRFDTPAKFFAALHENPQVITLDYSLPDCDGAEVLKKIKEYNKNIEVIIISGQEDVATAINLLKNGAYDYIVKDDDAKERIWNALGHLQERNGLKKEVEQLRTEVKRKYDFSTTMIGNSDAMQKVFGMIEKAAQTNITVSIYGETGSGKEMIAKAIHYHSDRQKKAFVAVNVAAIPRDLIESELFGHEKGAFTGAVTRRIGKFEEADGGSLFLDEIGELDINLQAKLLRVLQEKEITRVGSNQSVPVNARIIVATHKNLLEEVQKKTFREDLYYRLYGLPVHLPALRERNGDILLLAKFFVDSFCKENKMDRKTISPDAQQKLMGYRFPGNVRELKSIMELAVVMSEGETIEPENITLQSAANVTDLLTSGKTLREYNNFILQHYLDKNDGDVLKVARLLDIGKSTIYRMIQNKELSLV
ncbi:MAG TPA: sigma-54 dependent transcriptional regulator [Chitinophagaceae bacterium]|jgi:DNA-binding NtrC family response regulator